MLGDKEETFCFSVTQFKEGQMVKIGGGGGKFHRRQTG